MGLLSKLLLDPYESIATEQRRLFTVQVPASDDQIRRIAHQFEYDIRKSGKLTTFSGRDIPFDRRLHGWVYALATMAACQLKLWQEMEVLVAEQQRMVAEQFPHRGSGRYEFKLNDHRWNLRKSFWNLQQTVETLRSEIMSNFQASMKNTTSELPIKASFDLVWKKFQALSEDELAKVQRRLDQVDGHDGLLHQDDLRMARLSHWMFRHKFD